MESIKEISKFNGFVVVKEINEYGDENVVYLTLSDIKQINQEAKK